MPHEHPVRENVMHTQVLFKVWNLHMQHLWIAGFVFVPNYDFKTDVNHVFDLFVVPCPILQII